jgi:hypothetical protein
MRLCGDYSFREGRGGVGRCYPVSFRRYGRGYRRRLRYARRCADRSLAPGIARVVQIPGPCRNFRAKSQDNDLLSQDNDLLSQDNDLLSQDNDLLSQDNDLLSQDNDLLSQDNGLPSQDNGLPSQDNGLLSQDNGLLSQDNGLLS